MSTGLKRNWRNGDEWRSVAFTVYRDSREYRHILDLNPSFDIRSIPAPGVVINVSGITGPDKPQPYPVGQPGTLQQVDTNLNLTAGSVVAPSSTERSIFPWADPNLYVNRLGDYTAAALLSPDRTNGFSLDSPQANRDTQIQ